MIQIFQNLLTVFLIKNKNIKTYYPHLLLSSRRQKRNMPLQKKIM